MDKERAGSVVERRTLNLQDVGFEPFECSVVSLSKTL